MPPVRHELVPARVLSGDRQFDAVESAVRIGPARHVADHPHRAPDLHPTEISELLASVHHDGDTRITLEVGPPLTADHRIEPYESPVLACPLRVGPGCSRVLIALVRAKKGR